jgi:RNA recognition motif-containing protein
MSDDNNTNYKVFVGNVPFQCAKEEFEDCFRDIPGFINAEIVNRFNSTYSRGFGFVTFDTYESAKELLDRKNLTFKDRILRFTEYTSYENKEKNKNYLFVKNIPETTESGDLKNIFKQYGEIGLCCINTNTKTGEHKGTGIVEMKDKNIYEKLLLENNVSEGDIHFDLTRWKYKTFHTVQPQNKFVKPDTKDIYRIAFNAGRNIGLLEGIKIGKSNKTNC